MYFWNTKALAQDIKNDNLTDYDWKNYYLTGSLIITLSMSLTSLSPQENITASLVGLILLIGIVIFGVSITFNTHQFSGNCKGNYISKMTALAVPITFKLFAFAFIIGLFLGIAKAQNEAFMVWGSVVISVLVQAIFFWRLNVHLKDINN